MENKEFLKNVVVPSQTSTYKPVSYGELMDLVVKVSEEEGLVIKSEKYSYSQKGMVAIGIYDYDYGGDSEIGLRVVWQNSYNKQVSLKFAMGAHVFVCSNGMVYGDMGFFKKKHVGEIQKVTPDTIREYISTAKEVFTNLLEFRDTMKDSYFHRSNYYAIWGKLFFQDIVKSSQLEKIKRELKNPTYNYNAEDSVWELYNITTHALSESNPREYLDVHNRLHQFFIDNFSLQQIK